jgi:hypothetical protein
MERFSDPVWTVVLISALIAVMLVVIGIFAYLSEKTENAVDRAGMHVIEEIQAATARSRVRARMVRR